MNALLAFLFSFLLFAETPVALDTPATADAPMSRELPRVTHFQAPSYPEMAWQAKVHGKVTLKILVHKDGRFAFAEDPAGPPALVSAERKSLLVDLRVQCFRAAAAADDRIRISHRQGPQLRAAQRRGHLRFAESRHRNCSGVFPVLPVRKEALQMEALG
jgi:hypothetical protein